MTPLHAPVRMSSGFTNTHLDYLSLVWTAAISARLIVPAVLANLSRRAQLAWS